MSQVETKPRAAAATEGRVEDIMTRDVRTVHPKLITMQATKMMAQFGIRHLIVREDGARLMGVVSQRDLLKHIARCFSEERPPARTEVSEYMATALITIKPDLKITEAACLMRDKKVGCLPVVDAAGQLVGIITRSDILRYVGSHGDGL